jgi:hypothetical protein
MRSLDELSNIKIKYSDLPWNAIADGGESFDNSSPSIPIDIDLIIMPLDVSIVEDMADLIDNNTESLGFAECTPGRGQ